MEVVFTYKIGDKVWFMFENQPREGEIVRLWYRRAISCVDYETISDNVKYGVKISNIIITDFDVDKIFPDKESLIKSL